VLFKPEDADDLAQFIAQCPKEIPITIIGVGSNLLVRDGGVEGVVIRLGRAFTEIKIEGEFVHAGAGALDVNVAQVACEHGLAGLEFLSGVPGTIGGALAMNAGAYDFDMSEVLIEAELIDDTGRRIVMPMESLGYRYRGSHIPSDWIFTRATLRGVSAPREVIEGRMQEIAKTRGDTQPIRSKTGGSTFKNPRGMKAWELIDRAGCRGLTVGGAQVSEKHCNFLINTGGATAADLEQLGEKVRRRVFDKTGTMLEWEIKRIGREREA
jgi:UDP-N-acetylmuramate dehydrogenase